MAKKDDNDGPSSRPTLFVSFSLFKLLTIFWGGVFEEYPYVLCHNWWKLRIFWKNIYRRNSYSSSGVDMSGNNCMSIYSFQKRNEIVYKWVARGSSRLSRTWDRILMHSSGFLFNLLTVRIQIWNKFCKILIFYWSIWNIEIHFISCKRFKCSLYFYFMINYRILVRTVISFIKQVTLIFRFEKLLHIYFSTKIF